MNRGQSYIMECGSCGPASVQPSPRSSCSSYNADMARDYVQLFDAIQNKLQNSHKIKCEGIAITDKDFSPHSHNFYRFLGKKLRQKLRRIKPIRSKRTVIRDPLLPKEKELPLPNSKKHHSIQLSEKKPDIEEYGAIRGHGFKYFNTLISKKRQCDKNSDDDDDLCSIDRQPKLLRSSSQCRSYENLDYTQLAHGSTDIDDNYRKGHKHKTEELDCTDEPPPSCILRKYFQFYKKKRKCPPPKVTWSRSRSFEHPPHYSDAALKKVTPSRTQCHRIISKSPSHASNTVGDNSSLYKTKACQRKNSYGTCNEPGFRYNTARCKTEKPTNNVIYFEGVPITQRPRRKDRCDAGVHGYTYYRQNGTVRPPGKVPSCGNIKKCTSRKYSNADLSSQCSRYSNTPAPPYRRNYEQLKEQVLYCGGCPPKGSSNIESCNIRRQCSRYNTSRRRTNCGQLTLDNQEESKVRGSRRRQKRSPPFCRKPAPGSYGSFGRSPSFGTFGKSQSFGKSRSCSRSPSYDRSPSVASYGLSRSCGRSPSCERSRSGGSCSRLPSRERSPSCGSIGRSPSCTRTPSRGIIKYDNRCEKIMRNQGVSNFSSTCIPPRKRLSAFQKSEQRRKNKCFELNNVKSSCSIKRSCVKFVDEIPPKKKVQQKIASTKNKNVVEVLDKCGQNLKELQDIMQKMLKTPENCVNQLNDTACDTKFNSQNQVNDICYQCIETKPVAAKCCLRKDEKSIATKCDCNYKISKVDEYSDDESLIETSCQRKNELSVAKKSFQQHDIESKFSKPETFNKKPSSSKCYQQKFKKPATNRRCQQNEESSVESLCSQLNYNKSISRKYSQQEDQQTASNKCCQENDEFLDSLRCQINDKKSISRKYCQWEDQQTASNNCNQENDSLDSLCCQIKAKKPLSDRQKEHKYINSEQKNKDSLDNLCRQHIKKKTITRNRIKPGTYSCILQNDEDSINNLYSGFNYQKPRENNHHNKQRKLTDSCYDNWSTGSSTLSDYEEFCNKNTQSKMR